MPESLRDVASVANLHTANGMSEGLLRWYRTVKAGVLNTTGVGVDLLRDFAKALWSAWCCSIDKRMIWQVRVVERHGCRHPWTQVDRRHVSKTWQVADRNRDSSRSLRHWLI